MKPTIGMALLALAAAVMAADRSALDKATLEAYLRHLFLWGPEVHVQISDPRPSAVEGLLEVRVRAQAGAASAEQSFYVSKDGRRIVQGVVYDVNDTPFRDTLSKLKTDGAPALGTPGAPVELVLFSDFQCPFCKEEGRMLRQHLLAAYPTQVRLYFKDYPLESIHPWAKAAAIAGRCVFRQSQAAFWEFHDWVYERQAELTRENLNDKVLEFARGRPVDALQLRRCLETRATEAEVEASIAEGRALQVNSTPTLFVNGRRLAAQVSWPQLKAIIDFELENQKTVRTAGGARCCEVKVSLPVGAGPN
ncbi:MAG: thioredoxin domain-containing protein [Bryobacterales bacterium]|nr:thioredoxin domain-containing protein [Bryobacteraceae bacterium]MDW8353737.1 thioredoxin domain-containing protein [Bryobacterales bacterium]